MEPFFDAVRQIGYFVIILFEFLIKLLFRTISLLGNNTRTVLSSNRKYYQNVERSLDKLSKKKLNKKDVERLVKDKLSDLKRSVNLQGSFDVENYKVILSRSLKGLSRVAVFLFSAFIKLLKETSRFIDKKSDLLFEYFSKVRTKNTTQPDAGKKIRVSFYDKLMDPVKYVLIFLMGVLFALFFILLPFQVYSWFQEIPNPETLVTESGGRSTKILDRKGRLLYEIYIDKRYEPVKLNLVPEHMVSATIAVEDSEFYEHEGVRPLSMIRAAKETLVDGNLQGGSTITQQLIKNVLLTPERTVERKIKEIALALLVETRYSKDEILELYLNNISYGGTSWGIQAASQKYFGKNVWELELSESAMLAGLPTAPTTYSPLNNLEVAKQRQRFVLDRMVLQGFITQEESEDAFGEELVFAEQIEYIRAPHFVDYVRRDLESKYGKRFVDFGGLTVTTTLDLDLQEKVQLIVKEEVQKSEKYNISNGAAVVMDAKDAGLLAYVGSIDYFRDVWGAYDVASAYRQPGSSIKPVTYSLALSNDNYTPATILKDSPVTFNIKGSPPYKPVNYDGKFHGNVTIRQALANSYNVPAVKLANALGPDNIVSLGSEYGLSNWKVGGSYGLSVTLGGEEVKLVELTNLYGTFSREGIYKEIDPYLSIKDSNGFNIENGQTNAKRVVSKGVAYLIWHILSDNNARLPAFGTRNSLTIKDYRIAVKTGTTDEKRDNWTLGFTPSYVVGVWVGNNDNEPMNKQLASGLTGAAPMWNRIISLVLEGEPNEIMKMPDTVFEKVDKLCGNKREIFIKGSKVPSHLCTIETKKTDKNDNKRKKER